MSMYVCTDWGLFDDQVSWFLTSPDRRNVGTLCIDVLQNLSNFCFLWSLTEMSLYMLTLTLTTLCFGLFWIVLAVELKKSRVFSRNVSGHYQLWVFSHLVVSKMTECCKMLEKTLFQCDVWQVWKSDNVPQSFKTKTNQVSLIYCSDLIKAPYTQTGVLSYSS